MFAHQVIESIKSGLYQPEGYGEILETVAKAQKFHVGDYGTLLKMTNAMLGGKMFPDNTDYLVLPYKTMWIDATDNAANGKPMTSNKYGLLVEQKHDSSWELTPFSAIGKEWDINPVILQINPPLRDVKYRVLRYQYDQPPDDVLREMVSSAAYPLAILIQSIQIMNCKNIRAENIPAPTALNKKRRNAGKQELFDYHVLNVVVPSKKRGYHEPTEPLSHNRVHLCRGHFKEYTAEHPLFGHYTGLYWWQPHVRGQNKSGVVMKDYAVSYRC